MPQDPSQSDHIDLASGIQVSRIESDNPGYDTGLCFALTGRTDDAPAIGEHNRNLKFLAQASGVQSTVFVAKDAHNLIRSAALHLESPGRSALIYLSPKGSESVALPLMVEQIIEYAKARKINLLQTLLHTGDATRARVLSKLNFQYLAELIYMQCRVAKGEVDRRGLSNRFTLHTYSSQNETLFVEALQGSYEDSHDCPALTPLRTTEDALRGHKATGIYDPSGFYVVTEGTNPVAILLTACALDRSGLEVVYMGVQRSGRRRGLGSGLLALAKNRARELGLANVTLAVDSTNEAARRLYTRAGFNEQVRRRAWIRSI